MTTTLRVNEDLVGNRTGGTKDRFVNLCRVWLQLVVILGALWMSLSERKNQLG